MRQRNRDRRAAWPLARSLRQPLVAALLLVSLAPPAEAHPPPPEHFFDWTRLLFAPEEYARRRAALGRELDASGGGIFLAPSRAGLSDGTTFRQLDDFLYFTGLELPDSVLAIEAPDGRATLFAPRRDARFENPARSNDFPGRPLADDPRIAEVAGVAAVRPVEELLPWLMARLEKGLSLRVDLGRPGPVEPLPAAPVRPSDPPREFADSLRGALPKARLTNAFAEVARLRMIKSPAEIAVLRRAARLTAQAIQAAAAEVRAGTDERSLEAAFEAACKRGGAQRLAFSSIIKSGPNSLWPWRILGAHYDRRNRRLQDGELVIFDVGCELDSYASDVGRTVPVAGRFTPEQRRVLALEVAVADAIIRAVRPGVTLNELGVVARSQIPEAAQSYMQAAGHFGHHIGLSAGDPSLADVPLAPGMVLTVEPWYYDHDHGLAVFTEEVILVTEQGAEVLTAGLPRSPTELERLVARGRRRGPSSR
ncbi:MAG TPA: Xaa-Pro peptidase family protein [Polyangia bacterium]|nr:Xaa-Pro peptidase family protein [Polyangia bacterium]